MDNITFYKRAIYYLHQEIKELQTRIKTRTDAPQKQIKTWYASVYAKKRLVDQYKNKLEQEQKNNVEIKQL